MRKFTSGLITGGILGAACLTAVLSDKSQRKKIARKSRKLADTAADAMDDVRSKIW